MNKDSSENQELYGNNFLEEEIQAAPASVETPKRPSYHFKMIKTDTHGEPTTKTYMKWGAVALFVGVSVVSFATQSILAIKDYAFGDGRVGGIFAKSSVPADESKQLGSDDADTLPPETEDLSGGANSTDTNGNQYQVENASTFPRLTAGAFLAADLKTGEIIVEKNEKLVAPIASVSKLMTALVAEEQMDLQKLAIVSRDSYNTYGAQGRLVLGEKIRLYDLMYPLLMESSNDAAEVIADAYQGGHAEFLAEMNKKAVALGMTNTYYEDPSGLNPKNVSTVEDLLKLGRFIYQTKPTIYDMTRVRQYSILKHQWTNLNRFLNYDTFLGGKNGYIDESKKTTVSLFDVNMARGGKRAVVIVILKSDDREGDAVKIINFLKKNAYFSE